MAPLFEEVESRLVYGCNFPSFRSVDGKTSVQQIIPNKSSGIYVLSHKDGTFYVGLSINAGRRFHQHLLNKRPITAYTFRKVHKSNLDIVESETISILKDMKAKVTNTEKMKVEVTSKNSKSHITPKEMERWLTDDSWNDLKGNIPRAQRPYGDIEEKYRSEFLHKPYAQDIIGFYREYVKKCIIKPYKTVPEKWNVTCLPTTSYEFGKAISLLNVGGQGAVLIAEQKGQIKVWLAVRKSVFRRVHPNGIERLKSLAPSVIEKKSEMSALGEDQLDIIVPLSEAKDLLKDKGLIHAIRALVIHKRGMGLSGESIYKRHHCFSLAKDILSKESLIGRKL